MSIANVRLLAGLLALPSILFQRNFLAVIIQCLYVIVVAVSYSRRFKLLPNLILLFSVSLAHLLQPNGLLLFSIGKFPITLGALTLGAHKAFTLISLLYLSHYIVTARPKFPGLLGQLISLQFYFFEQIREVWQSIKVKRPLIGAIDEMLLKISLESAKVAEHSSPRASPKELLFNAFHVVALWTLFFLGYYSILPILN